MAYAFAEATFKAQVLERIKNELAGIQDSQIRKAIKACFVGLVEEIADELELIDAEI